MRPIHLALFVLAAALAGCTNAGPPSPATAGTPADLCDSGQSYFYLVNTIDVSKPQPDGTAPGFDLDGRVSDRTDPLGCHHADFQSPAPDSLPGVDDQLGVIAQDLQSSYDISQSLASSVHDGKLALVVQVQHVDDLTNDACVNVEVGLGYLSDGSTMPALGADGLPAAGQQYDIRPIASAQGRIENGRLTTDPVEIDSAITLTTPPAPFTIKDAQLEFDIDADQLTNGVIGGSVDVAMLENVIAQLMPSMSGLANVVLESNADLDPAPSDGTCSALSAGFTFAGVQAVHGADLPPR